jgi:hypothetical protein
MENKTEPEIDIFVPLSEFSKFDWKRVVIEDPVTNAFTKKGTTTPIKWTTSKVHYKGQNGEKLPIFFQFVKQKSWGLNGCWPINLEEDQQTSENMEGFQTCYNLTSLETVNNPTKDEQSVKMIHDKAWELTVAAMKRFCNEEIQVVEKGETITKNKLEGPAYSAYWSAERKKNMKLAVKPTYDFANSEDKTTKVKFLDKSKPLRSYIKLSTKGKGDKMVCNTKIYGPGDKLVSPMKYMTSKGHFVQGEIEPVVQWDSVFWGSHGTEKPYGGSVKFIISEMNFTPQNDSTISRRRMLSPNKASAETEDTDGNGSDDDDNTSFTHPMGNTKNVEQSSEFKSVAQQKAEALLHGNVKTGEDTGDEDENKSMEEDEDALVEDEEEIITIPEPIKPKPKAKVVPTKPAPKVVEKKITKKKNT